MTYQSKLNIKDEQLSPPVGHQMLAVRGSRKVSRVMPRAGTPAKLLKSESEGRQASTPEIKKKLQTAVLDRRKANGDTGIPSNLFEEAQVCELTQEDLNKRERRKEQNRNAAKKCRAKKKELQDEVEKKTAQYIESNAKMKQLLDSFYRNLFAVWECLSQHLNGGDCRVSAEAQEEHKQLICETATLLESYRKEEEYGKKEQTSPATVNIYQENSSQLSSSSDNHASNCEPLSSTYVYQQSFINDSADTTFLNTNVPSLGDLGNLPSSNLEDIFPDIPFTFPNMDTEKSLTTSFNDTKCEFTEAEPQDNFTRASFHDLNLPSLTEDGLTPGPASTNDWTCLKVETTGGFHEKDDLPIFHLNNRVFTCSQFRKIGTSDLSTSPNLVQQNLTCVRSCPSLMTTGTIQRDIGNRHLSQGNRHFIGQQCQVNADINNNGRKQSAAPQTGENYSVCVDYSSICNNLPQNDSTISPRILSPYFTFENDQLSPEESGPPGDEPISPFYTQGGDRRL